MHVQIVYAVYICSLIISLTCYVIKSLVYASGSWNIEIWDTAQLALQD